MSRTLPTVLFLSAALAVPAAPVRGWDWQPPEGAAVVDLGILDRVPQRWGLILLAGLRQAVARAPAETGLEALHYGVTLQDYRLFDTNRDRLMAVLRNLAADLARHRFGEFSAAHAEALMELAGPYGFGPPDYAAAEAPMRAGVAIARQIGDPSASDALLGHVERLARTLSALGQHAEAAGLLREVLEDSRGQPDPDPLRLQPLIWALAEELAAGGSLDEAAALFTEGLDILRADRDRHPSALIGPLRQVADVLDPVDPRQAQALRQEAAQLLEAQQEAGRIEIPHTQPRWLAALADVLAESGQIDEASRLHLQALDYSNAMLGAQHPRTRAQAHRALAHLRRHDPAHPALPALAERAARDP